MSIEELRQQASETPLEEQDAEQTFSASVRLPSRVRFLGMTPFQTCIVAALLLIITCLLSTFCLLVTGKVVPPVF